MIYSIILAMIGRVPVVPEPPEDILFGDETILFGDEDITFND